MRTEREIKKRIMDAIDKGLLGHECSQIAQELNDLERYKSQFMQIKDRATVAGGENAVLFTRNDMEAFAKFCKLQPRYSQDNFESWVNHSKTAKIMNLIDCYVTRVLGEPKYIVLCDGPRWFVCVEYTAYGRTGESTRFFKTEQEARSTGPGYHFLA